MFDGQVPMGAGREVVGISGEAWITAARPLTSFLVSSHILPFTARCARFPFQSPLYVSLTHTLSL